MNKRISMARCLPHFKKPIVLPSLQADNGRRTEYSGGVLFRAREPDADLSYKSFLRQNFTLPRARVPVGLES